MIESGLLYDYNSLISVAFYICIRFSPRSTLFAGRHSPCLVTFSTQNESLRFADSCTKLRREFRIGQLANRTGRLAQSNEGRSSRLLKKTRNRPFEKACLCICSRRRETQGYCQKEESRSDACKFCTNIYRNLVATTKL